MMSQAFLNFIIFAFQNVQHFYFLVEGLKSSFLKHFSFDSESVQGDNLFRKASILASLMMQFTKHHWKNWKAYSIKVIFLG